MAVKRGVKPVAQNRKARHDYFIEETLECGIELFGTEVKSLRKGACNLKDSYAQVKNGELFVIGMHISPYEQGNIVITSYSIHYTKLYDGKYLKARWGISRMWPDRLTS